MCSKIGKPESHNNGYSKVEIIRNVNYIFFSFNNRLGNYFSFKDKISLKWRSIVLQKFMCHKYNSVYYGKTKRHCKVRGFEHLGISLRTDK